MEVKPTLVLDARKAYDSGIGTYIRNLIPFLKQEFILKLIGPANRLNQFECQVLETFSKAYSLSDFYQPSILAGKSDIFWTPHFNFPLLPPNTRLKVSTIHDLYHKANWTLLSVQQKIIYSLFLENVSRRADLIFTISEFSRKEIQRFYPKMIPKTEVILEGVDTDLFKYKTEAVSSEIKSRYQLPNRYILFVGNLKPNKNVITLLKAYHLWIKESSLPDVKIVITGKKEGFRMGDNEAVDFIEKNQLGNEVIFTGFVEEEHLPLLYQNAWLFVFPSLYEGFGLPPLEAMACGCPVATSSSASLPEVCGKHAFYFDGENPSDLKQLLQRLYANPSLLAEKSEPAINFVQKYDWSLTAENHIRILKDALKKKSA